MKVWCLFLLLPLLPAMGCGEGAGDLGGTGGGDSLTAQSTYALSCTIGVLVLEIPIELTYELDRPYVAGGSAALTFLATLTFAEQASTALIEAGVDKIDIVSVKIATRIEGATPPIVETSFGAAPINDFDLHVDTDDNEIAGPHHLDLDAVTITTTPIHGADRVELGLGLDQVSLLLGDFRVPVDCISPTLVGSSVSFATRTGSDSSEHQQPR